MSLATTDPRRLRLRRAGVIAVGALVMLAAIRSRAGPLDFSWVPLFSGAIYLGAAMAGGRRSSYWSPTCILLPLGAAIAVLDVWELRTRTAAVYLMAVGAGILLAAIADRVGVAVTFLGLGSCVAVFGTLFLADRYWTSVIGRVESFAAAYAVWAAVEFTRGILTPPPGAGEPAPGPPGGS